ncbi:GlxA family transcriptional regulator [Adhaeribacter radiodurans]|uniref:DJ-1/PfpI family protein n=1 Tax=Adhaeribacter radiodurans TaxID=2745197 RepID=A0A7L7L7K0_9BACT|nr:DJ-1/PfpI family protein [Adhaeribacter radiodurans]QMU28743.1 DJ-1/PfpI family protein [Adhaeribacter radiodurans]
MKIAFIIPPCVELLDLAGPLQVFTEAKAYGLEVSLEFYSYQPENVSSAGLPMGKVLPYIEAYLQQEDFLFIPGMEFDYLNSAEFKAEVDFFSWVKACADKQVTVCSVCNAAYILGEAGLLNNRECTTHWRRVKDLQARFPQAKVIGDTLYVKQDNIYTSAGISAGIDLALSVLEDLKGAFFTHQIARGLVVYQRRSQKHKQESIYLDYRNHLNPHIHEVQDHLINNLAGDNRIENLASLVAMSPRNLSRVFKEKTGITILEYLTHLRVEKAKTFLNNPYYTVDYVAAQCGFKTARQLQKLLKAIN